MRMVVKMMMTARMVRMMMVVTGEDGEDGENDDEDGACLCVGEARSLASLPSKEPVQVWSFRSIRS